MNFTAEKFYSEFVIHLSNVCVAAPDGGVRKRKVANTMQE